MQATPDISVIISAHNRGDMLIEAIASCRASARELVLQIIVIDDASDQDLASVVAHLGVVYDRLPVNSGSSTARNRGLSLANGRYIKFLDSDDVLVGGALQREYEAARDSNADIIVSGWVDTRLDQSGGEKMLRAYQAPAFGAIADGLLAGLGVPTSAALYKNSIAARADWDPALSKLNDWDYFVTAALQSSTIVSVDGPAYRWRQHSGARITSSATFVSNAKEFYVILAKLGAALQARGEFTPARQRRMAQYLFKELRGLYRFNLPMRHEILARILQLDPHFQPRDEERSVIFRLMFSILPTHWVLVAYGLARRGLDRLAAPWIMAAR